MSFDVSFAEAADAGAADAGPESALRGGASVMPLVYRANGPGARDQGM